jgi:transglutaminase-like putative cysteine protease
MLRNSLGIVHPAGLELNRPGTRDAWLGETPQLDFGVSGLRILATRLTQLMHTERSKAVAIHDHVKGLPFACVPDFIHTSASEVLKVGHGDCHTKGLLMVALLRAVAIPARLRFVTLSTRFLSGLIDTGSQTMTHAMTEVLLEGRWYQIDTYVVDSTLSREAREQLFAKQHKLGLGVHAYGDQDWNGLHDAHAQYAESDPDSLPVVDWGVDHDPAHFYADESHAALRRTFGVRMKWVLGAHLVNRKIEQIRRRGDAALVGSMF